MNYATTPYAGGAYAGPVAPTVQQAVHSVTATDYPTYTVEAKDPG